MRQTSRAVALLLLLESAQAADNTQAANSTALKVDVEFGSVDIVTNFNASAGIAANALTNRMAPYKQVLNTWAWGPLLVKATLWPAATATITTTPSSGCMLCLNNSGVWCSATYAYLSTTTSLQSDKLDTSGFLNLLQTSISDGLRKGGAGLDQGSCCSSTWLMSKTVGSAGVPGLMPTYNEADSEKTITTTSYATASTAAPALTGQGCIAMDSLTPVPYVSGTNGQVGPSTWNVTFATFSSWWCSNGLYKQVHTASAGSFSANFNQQIASNTNKRLELAQVACPQVDTYCGYAVAASGVVAGFVGNDITSAPKAYVVAGGVTPTKLNWESKCTWVAYAYAMAPTFAVTQSTATGLTSNWEIHTMEYVTGVTGKGRLIETAVTTGLNPAGAISGVGVNFVPLFQMPAAAFGALRTWYGVGAWGANDTSEPANWYAPGQNYAGTSIVAPQTVSDSLKLASTQYFGNVANIAQATFYSDSTSSAVPLGSTFGLVGSTKFDLRQVRYMPASAAQNVWAAGSTLNTSYSTAVTSYTTAKGVWDAYVAILTSNAKQDAFAAMFSPPKAPTVPPLPNMPWTPPVYSGFQVVTAAAQAAMLKNGLLTEPFLAAANPSAGGFWANQSAAESVGGWGSFTAQIIRFQKGWGKSFGTIGFSGDAKAQEMSQVWNMPWMCVTADSTKELQTSDKACQATYAPGANGATSTTTTLTPLNINGLATGGRLVVAVSLWSKGNMVSGSPDTVPANKYGITSTTTAGEAQDFTITFTAKVWSTQLQALAAITAPGAPGAAATLSGIAGAQALAASAAAALAVAAALY